MACYHCRIKSHSEEGFTPEIRKRSCSAYKTMCEGCWLMGYYMSKCKMKENEAMMAKTALAATVAMPVPASLPAFSPPPVDGATAFPTGNYPPYPYSCYLPPMCQPIQFTPGSISNWSVMSQVYSVMGFHLSPSHEEVNEETKAYKPVT